MSDEQWYVRKSGKITGPFTRTAIEALRKRGQLSHFHEVSSDRQNWASAGSHSWLFPEGAGAGTSGGGYGGGSSGGSYDTIDPGGGAGGAPPQPATQGWFYNDAASTAGPVMADQITALLRTGRLTPDTPVWREGFISWIPIREVPEFAGMVTKPQPGYASGEGPSQGDFAPMPIHSNRRVPLYIGVASLVITLVLGIVFFDRIRKGGFAARTLVIDSHTSTDIVKCVGHVITGASLTHLKTGRSTDIKSVQGTCFAIAPDGYMITNKHVVEEYVNLTKAKDLIAGWRTNDHLDVEPKLWIFLGRDKYTAKVLYVSSTYDAALIKLDLQPGKDSFPYFRFANKTNIRQGVPVYALGFPAVNSQPLSPQGIVDQSKRESQGPTVIERTLDESDFDCSILNGIIALLRKDNATEYIQHTATISGGNSGGPLIYEDGSVLGINTLISFQDKASAVGVKYYALSLPQIVDEMSKQYPQAFPK